MSAVTSATMPAIRPATRPAGVATKARRRLTKAGLAAAAATTLGLTLSSCSPVSAVWYPLARPGVLSQGFSAGHPGVDLYVPQGTGVHAATAGVVSFAGWYYGYGNYVCVTRDAGFRSCYAHLSYIYARPGLHVSPGQTIGLSGMTGDATGPHLHFEIYRYGHAVNPLPYLPPR